MRELLAVGYRKWFDTISVRPGELRIFMLFAIVNIISEILLLILNNIWKYRKTVITSNIYHAFQGIKSSDVSVLTFHYYKHLADLVAEQLLTACLRPDEIKKLVRYQNQHLLTELFHARRDVVLMASHAGNWEYLFTLPMVTGYRVVVAYSPLSSRFLDKKMKYLRTRYGVQLIDKKDYYRFVIREKASFPTLYIVIADQRPGKSSSHSVSFFDQQTMVQAGGERIAMRLGSPVLYLDVIKRKRHFYDFRFELLSLDGALENTGKITADYYVRLEKTIRRQPELWLWSHRRWKGMPGM